MLYFKDGVKDIYKGHRIYDDVIIGDFKQKKIKITNNSYINLHADLSYLKTLGNLQTKIN